MKQPDLRAGGSGKPGELVRRRSDYRDYRSKNVHALWKGMEVLQEDAAEFQGLDLCAEDEFRWVPTPTSERIIAGLRYAQFSRDIVVIYGGAGVGKSHCIRHYLSSAPSVYLIELCPAFGGLLASLQETCRALGIHVHSGQAAQMHRSICAKLRNETALLIFDEAQELTMHALDQVRCIHDQTKVGIALVGNEQVYLQIAGSNRPAYLDRLYSRIGKRIHLAHAMPGDAQALVHAMAIEDGAARARLCQIGSRPGALRLLQKIARLAEAYAAGEERPLSLSDVEAAWADLCGKS